MSLLKGTGVGKYFGAQDVFKNLDFSIEMADRIGLVGPNGEGKTTLREILAGVQEATAGQLQRLQIRNFWETAVPWASSSAHPKRSIHD